MVENIRTEALSGLSGSCPHCGNEMIAKCGSIKINHWAHKVKRKRDCKWEAETIWHRNWKNKFPIEWQEFSQRDASGEIHIADIFTPEGLAIEFLHSLIARQEVEARTNFYPKICWVIDGLRLKSGWEKFCKALRIGFNRAIGNINIHKIFTQDSRLLHQWENLGSKHIGIIVLQ